MSDGKYDSSKGFLAESIKFEASKGEREKALVFEKRIMHVSISARYVLSF